jgi:hypothetical protein
MKKRTAASRLPSKSSKRQWKRIMTQVDHGGSSWGSLYKIAGVAALIFIVYSLITMIIFLLVGQLPDNAMEAFHLIQDNRFLGLLRLDVLTLLTIPLYYPIFLSLYAALKEVNRSYTTLGSLLAFAGVTLFLATPSVFPLVSLSDQYAAAETLAEKERYLAAGEAILASDMWHGTGAAIGGFLLLIGGLALSIVMLKSETFTRWTALVGILTNGLDLTRSVLMLFAPTLGTVLMVIAGPLYLVWFPLLARDFFEWGDTTTN